MNEEKTTQRKIAELESAILLSEAEAFNHEKAAQEIHNVNRMRQELIQSYQRTLDYENALKNVAA